MSKQRVVVITGGGSGMGRAMALAFADLGDRVFILGRNRSKLENVAKENKNIQAIVCDISDVDAVEAARNTISREHKYVDVLVNNAGGILRPKENDSTREILELWKKVIDVNLNGVFNMVYIFKPLLRRPGGRVINISSTAALIGSTSGGVGAAYAAAKAGLHGFSRTLVHELSGDGITVNCVAPGVVDHTEFFTENGVPDDRRQKYLDMIPLKKLGTPEDIAAGVIYLASDEAGFITGEILNINGGMVFGR